MVVVPVRLYPAVRKKHVRFHELDGAGRRVRHMRVSEPEYEIDREVSVSAPPPSSGEIRPSSPPPPSWSVSDVTPAFGPRTPEVPYEEIRKGYEIAPGQYVTLSREEVAALAPEKSRVIDVEQFVNVADVDPIYYESRYHVVPDRASAKPFQLLAASMAAAERMALGWITLRQRRYLSSIRPYRDLMLLTTMVHADEILSAEFWMPDEVAAPTDRELKMARLLIDTLSGPFDPEYYKDEHRERVMRAIEARTPLELGSAEAPAPTKVMDLMAALEASVKAAKAVKAQQDKQDKQAKAPRRRSRGA